MALTLVIARGSMANVLEALEDPKCWLYGRCFLTTSMSLEQCSDKSSITGQPGSSSSKN